MNLQEIGANMALIVFSVSYAYYFERSMGEWPLFGRWIRYLHGLGRAYSYEVSDIVLVFIVGIGIFVFAGVYLFIISFLEFTKLNSVVFICFCILSYLFIPSLLFSLMRGVLQIIIPDDFIKSLEKTSKVKTGLSEEAGSIIKKEIETKNYFQRIRRVILSLLILALLYSLPWLFKFVEN